MSTITAHQTITQSVIGLVVTALTALPAPGMQAGDYSRSGAVVADGRAEVVMVAQGPTTGRRVGLATQAGQDLLAYRFRVEAVGQGTQVAGADGWDVRVTTGSDVMSHALHLTASRREFTVPRPWGLRLSDADSMDVIVSIPGATEAEITFRLTIEFDQVDQAASRTEVRAIGAARQSSDDDRVQVWQWTQPQSGRLQVLDIMLGSAVISVTLVDADNATELWSRVVDGRRSTAPVGAGTAIRAGTPLIAGHTYRVIMTPAAGQPSLAPLQDVVALVLR